MSEKILKNLRLACLYDSKKITDIWNSYQDKPLINHPQQGWISPNKYRSLYADKPCPYCGKKMLQGQEQYSTISKQVALKRGYRYKNKQGNLTFNRIGNIYYHPNYITLDHKMNKARFPELMFDFNNLEAICWRCNKEKKDNNAFELEHNLEYFNNLCQEVNERYKQL
jgi:5-methylcytosine-specific restriction endonuclease McrA